MLKRAYYIMNTMPDHLNLCLFQKDRKKIIFITLINSHFHYDSNGGIFVSSGYELLDVISQLL